MNNIYSVSDINKHIKDLLDDDYVLSEVYVRGEISNYKKHSSGHHYFSLKDKDGVISAVMFKFDAFSLKVALKDGMKVIAFGKVSSFVKSGQYQLYVKEIVLDGIGDLHLEFERLKQKLHKEGLFNTENKKELPRFPQTIAVVTSPTGAVFSDIKRVISGRYRLADILLLPVKVQGEGASEEISNAINHINNNNLADVIIIGRGGGSIEDLWAFNDENLAYTIFASNIPIISAVGHEPDYTISDFVADVRAATPSNAAEIVVPDSTNVSQFLDRACDRMEAILNAKILTSKQSLKSLESKIIEPQKYIDNKRMYIDFLMSKLENPSFRVRECRTKVFNLSQKIDYLSKQMVEKKRQKTINLIAYLDGYSPLKILSRGYGYSLDKNEKIIKSVKQVEVGDDIKTRYADGVVSSKIIKIEE